MKRLSRRDAIKAAGAAGAAGMLTRGGLETAAAQQAGTAPADGTIVPRTSTGDAFVPPRGRSFQKFSFDFPEPSVAFHGYEFSVRVFTRENTYALSAPNISVQTIGSGIELTCTELVWAGGQQRTSGRVVARLTAKDDA